MPSKLKNTHNAFFALTLLVVAFPIWPMKMAAGAILLWFLGAVAYVVINGKKNWTKNAGLLLLFSSLFILHLMSFTWFDMPEVSAHSLERRLSLLAFPIGFYLVDPLFQKKQQSWILLCFELASFALTAYIAFVTIPLIIEHWKILQMGSGFNWAFRNHVEKLVEIHPTYLSLFLLFAVFLKLHRIVEKDTNQPWYNVLWDSFQIALMLLCCLLLSARGPLIAFGIALLVYFIQINWKRAVIGMAVSIPVIALLFLNVPAISSRFNELIQAQVTQGQENETMNSTQIRKEIYNCSGELLSEHWLAGVGIGNVQPALNDCYTKNDQETLRRMEFNTHNQYAHVWLSNGILGLVIFVLMLLIPYILSIRTKQLVYQSFLLMMIICFFTENILARQHGVVFFAFFNTLFAYHLFSPLKD